ncbi:MAG: DUF4179 domain-containing protein [Clostridia bacterium]|nr:DUF4179 domain-containing protein [Clostridia bacterium]
MNRNNEYFELLEKLDGVSVPEKCVTRAVRRRKINSFIMKPLASVAAFFLAFVLLVNLSPTVAKALEDVPVIGDITKAVTFTRTVRGAVESGYMQPLEAYASDGDVAIGLRNLVADEKNVSFTFELTGDLPEKFYPQCTYGTEDQTVRLWCDANTANTVLTASSTFIGQDAAYPDSGTLSIKLYEIIIPENSELVFTSDGGITTTTQVDQPDEPFAEFSFDVTVDKSLIAPAKHYDTYSELEVEGQKLLITGVDMYPTCTEVTVEQDASNSAWINRLEFNLRDDDGKVYLYGYSSTEGEAWDEMSRVYYADSMYFSNTKNVGFYLISCAFLDKAAEAAEIDLTTGELTVPTDVIRVIKAEKTEDRVYVKFEIPDEAQITYETLEELETLTETGYDSNTHRTTYEFHSNDYKSDKLKIGFIATGWYGDGHGRNITKCTVALPEN